MEGDVLGYRQQVDMLCRVESAGHVVAPSDIKSCRIDAIGSERTTRNTVLLFRDAARINGLDPPAAARFLSSRGTWSVES